MDNLHQQQQQQHRQEGFTVVSTDESFFFFDSLVRRVWIKKDERPVVRITGSHQESVLFGSIISLEGKQLFRQYDWFNATTFLDYLKQIHKKFPKCYLFLDKAKQQHHRSKKVLKYFADNKDNLIPVYLPTAFQEFMVLEEIWHIAKNDLLVQYYSSFIEFRNKISSYFRTKRFNLDMRNYLVEGE